MVAYSNMVVHCAVRVYVGSDGWWGLQACAFSLSLSLSLGADVCGKRLALQDPGDVIGPRYKFLSCTGMHGSCGAPCFTIRVPLAAVLF